jgi:hypothetical protein
VITEATTGSTLLRDIATAIETQRSDDRPIARRAVELFAHLNGWRWHPSFRFLPEGLGKYGNDTTYHRPYWCDHALYFRGQVDGKRGWVNIAIAGQPYQRSDSVRAELAELGRQGYCIHIPPGGDTASIWFPGQTLFIVVTLPGVTVKWLPEQLG